MERETFAGSKKSHWLMAKKRTDKGQRHGNQCMFSKVDLRTLLSYLERISGRAFKIVTVVLEKVRDTLGSVGSNVNVFAERPFLVNGELVGPS